MKILCLFGEYQYGIRSRGKSLEATSFIPALEKLGHNVKLFDIWDRSLYSDLDDLNHKLLSYTRNFQPDIVLFVPMTVEVWTETLDILRKNLGVRIIMWCTDDTWKFRETSQFLASHVDLVATTYDEAVSSYKSLGFDHVVKTQWAADSQRLCAPQTALHCAHQVSFVGQASSSRKKVIGELSKRGVNVECFGYGWPSGSLTANQVYETMRDSVITLNFADSYKGGQQLKARNFEAPGAGSFLLTEYVPGIEKYYTPDQEIICFRDTTECVEKIIYYLTQPQKRNEIANAGSARTRKEHVYEERLGNILNHPIIKESSCENSFRDQYEICFQSARKRYTRPVWLKTLRALLTSICFLLFRGRCHKAARRLIFEFSWRVFGQKTYSAQGWPGRMFPEL